jgi:hypothetical protein
MCAHMYVAMLSQQDSGPHKRCCHRRLGMAHTEADRGSSVAKNNKEMAPGFVVMLAGQTVHVGGDFVLEER